MNSAEGRVAIALLALPGPSHPCGLFEQSNRGKPLEKPSVHLQLAAGPLSIQNLSDRLGSIPSPLRLVSYRSRGALAGHVWRE